MAVSKYDIELDLTADTDSSHALVVSMIGSNERVLDVGCDTGYLGGYIEALGNATWAFEVNPVSAELARERHKTVEVGDVEALELGGSVIISVPNVAHTRFFTRDSLLRFVTEAGFVVLELRRTRRPLFRTEIAVAQEDFPPAFLAVIENDIEATTYQFVVRVVPDDVTQTDTAQALLVDSLREVHQQRCENTRLHDRQQALRSQIAELSRPARVGPSAPSAPSPPAAAAQRVSKVCRGLRPARAAWRRHRA